MYDYYVSSSECNELYYKSHCDVRDYYGMCMPSFSDLITTHFMLHSGYGSSVYITYKSREVLDNYKTNHPTINIYSTIYHAIIISREIIAVVLANEHRLENPWGGADEVPPCLVKKAIRQIHRRKK